MEQTMNNYEATLETVRGLSEGRLRRDPEAHLKHGASRPRYSSRMRFFVDTVSELKVQTVGRADSGMVQIKWPSGNVTEVSQQDLDTRFKETKP